MHIPDGYLDPTIIIITTIISAVFVAVGFFQMKKYFSTKHIPLFAVLTAGVFAAQLINFPIVGGTSGHLVGGTLISVFLGPLGALISMVLVLVIQAFLFADGGVTALGANILNMGIIGGFVGYFIYLGIRKIIGRGNWGIRIGAAIASYLAIALAALACGLEIGWSSNFPYGINITVPAMVGWNLIVGVGEAIITSVVIEYTIRVRPDMLELPKIGLKRLFHWRAEEIEEEEVEALALKPSIKTRKQKGKVKKEEKISGGIWSQSWFKWGVILGLIVIAVLLPISSSYPDSLEKVGETLALWGDLTGTSTWFPIYSYTISYALFPDYYLPQLYPLIIYELYYSSYIEIPQIVLFLWGESISGSSLYLSTLIPSIIGFFVTLGSAWLVGRILKRREPSPN